MVSLPAHFFYFFSKTFQKMMTLVVVLVEGRNTSNHLWIRNISNRGGGDFIGTYPFGAINCRHEI
ncbi:protein of unknown function [Petrocella atlantisensis]|uniref:Uncharacterized protein n=1 Tax=Petrocella atlantisensis TaxID=2173034 RepID=A0A3P7SC61_9FIRM|nr:protein of unknown function [Petrocella atlantisensis]